MIVITSTAPMISPLRRPMKNEQDHDHDGYRLGQVDEEFVDGENHRSGLQGDDAELKPERQLRSSSRTRFSIPRPC
jgi:hypothetical protein